MFATSRLTCSKMDIHLTQSSFTLHLVVAALVWTLYTSSRATVSAQGGLISCSVQSVKFKGNTSLICHFPENVQQTRRDFTVYYYRNKERPDAVLDCWWLSGNVDCFIAPGYKFSKKISREIFLEIPVVSGPQIGSYACQIASYGPDSISTCDLKLLLDGKSVCEVPSVQPDTQTSLSCFFPKDLNESKLGFTVYHYPIRGDADAVLNCDWKGDNLNCAVRKFNFENKVSDRLTLKIPRASQDQEGKYSCQTKGADILSYNNCSFSLQRAQKITSCSIQNVTEVQPTELRCNFNVDVGVARQNFKVVREGQDEDILTCTWPDGKLVCSTSPGYEFDNIVTNRLVVKVPRSSPTQNGTYTCHLQGFDPSDFQSCDFIVTPASVTSLDVGAVVGAVIALLLIIAIIITVVIVLYKRRCLFWRQTPQKTVSKEEQVTLLIKKEDVTQNFVKILKESSKEIYKMMETGFYFVPSLYVNKSTYSSEEFAGEQIFITQPSNEEDMKHDKAIQGILQNLHHMADSEKEAMFVISQFNYNSYLTTLKDTFSGHQLPMPAKLRQQDQNYGDFDLLIVHRQYGLVVVVVKTCSVGSGDGQDDTKLVDEVKKGVNQLLDAEHMLQHLLSDQQWNLAVHKTLMLPNISEGVLRGELGKHSLEGLVDSNGKMNLTLPMFRRKGTKKRNAFPNVSNQDRCLCAEELKSRSPKLWFKSDSSIINYEQYLTIISRFCSPASQSPLPVPNTRSCDILPVTPEHAVCLTGKLFETTILHEDHLSVLKEAPPRVGLCGPPGTGKTRTLELIGRRWMSEGHDVHVVSLWQTSLAASFMLCEVLGKKTDRTHKEGSQQAPQGRVVPMACDLKRDNAKDIVRVLKDKFPQRGELFILCDEVDHDGNDTLFLYFCKKLVKKVPTVHLWFASCFIENIPTGWQAKLFLDPISCPSVILKEKDVLDAVELCKITKWTVDSNTRTPTQGPSVKYVYHIGEEHSEGDPQDCKACSEEVIRYLQPLFTGKPLLTSESALTANSPSIGTGSPASELCLQDKDMMLLTECDVKENMMCLEMLKNLGFKTKLIKAPQTDSILKDTRECVLIANGKDVHGIKRKIVVFLEAAPTKSKSKKPGKPPDYLNRVRCLTSCTSQLIWVRIPEKHNF
ncbi:uncharacterized protein LOC112574906 [Pomacea canaliculata]|uniref:uncharacterized protein LOC112574906 n=1 Tax=Pomacea canaliculata TaxID=400727 RepID=UPI000D73F352|nr:uncharacterized protein LOC112574906 [Pomacea canaliculata]